MSYLAHHSGLDKTATPFSSALWAPFSYSNPLDTVGLETCSCYPNDPSNHTRSKSSHFDPTLLSRIPHMVATSSRKPAVEKHNNEDGFVHCERARAIPCLIKFPLFCNTAWIQLREKKSTVTPSTRCNIQFIFQRVVGFRNLASVVWWISVSSPSRQSLRDHSRKHRFAFFETLPCKHRRLRQTWPKPHPHEVFAELRPDPPEAAPSPPNRRPPEHILARTPINNIINSINTTTTKQQHKQ